MKTALTILLSLLVPTIALGETANPQTDSTNTPKIDITVHAPRVANTLPSDSFSTPVTALRYEPLIDLQGRNFAEAQADVAIRGGTFENSSFSIGAATLFDPQTGHYYAELPIPTSMLSTPTIRTGFENAVFGFNSTAGSINYGFSELTTGGNLEVGGGTNNLNRQTARAAAQNIFGFQGLGFEIEGSRSEGDGSYRDSDDGGNHNFERVAGRAQFLTQSSQTDLFIGGQNKFFAWPYLYALRTLHNIVGSSGIESEDIRTRLFLLNHRESFGGGDFFEFTAYHRRNKDDYEFDIARPGLFNPFQHTTKVWGGAFNGKHNLAEGFDLNYFGHYLADDINSTALVFGPYKSREYVKFAFTPSYQFNLNDEYTLKISGGAAFDDSNRDRSHISPVLKASLSNDTTEWYVETSQTSQLPGYTAIGSNPSAGLFRGNQTIGREIATNYEAGANLKGESWNAHAATFFRNINNQTDWTFIRDTQPFAARTANNVDIELFGFEAVFSVKYRQFEFTDGYTYLHKDYDYGDIPVNGSFYALNFPRHRYTKAIIFRPCSSVEIRSDNEFRYQEANPLRDSSDQSYFISSLSASWSPDMLAGVKITALVDNLNKESFEEVPGVPAQGRTVAGILSYSW